MFHLLLVGELREVPLITTIVVSYLSNPFTVGGYYMTYLHSHIRWIVLRTSSPPHLHS